MSTSMRIEGNKLVSNGKICGIVKNGVAYDKSGNELGRVKSNKTKEKNSVQAETASKWSAAKIALAASATCLATVGIFLTIFLSPFSNKGENVSFAGVANSTPAVANLNHESNDTASSPNQPTTAQPEKNPSVVISPISTNKPTASESKIDSTVVSKTAVYNPGLEVVKFKAEREDRKLEEKEKAAQIQAKENRVKQLALLKSNLENRHKNGELMKSDLSQRIQKAQEDFDELNKKLSRQKNQRVPIRHIRTTEISIKQIEAFINIAKNKLTEAEYTSNKMKENLEAINKPEVDLETIERAEVDLQKFQLPTELSARGRR